MILVTTSRRSTPVIRTIAKDLAFATGGRYLSRGKHGLREIASEYDLFVVIEQQQSHTLITLYRDGEPEVCRIIHTIDSGVREGLLFRGVRTSDTEFGELLEKSCTVHYENSDDLFIIFDGPQKRCMKLMLSPGVLNEA